MIFLISHLLFIDNSFGGIIKIFFCKIGLKKII